MAMSLSWLPNAISLLRIALIAPILLLILDGQFGWALALFFVAGFSDGLDGYLAVRFNWTTRLGGLLDPAADKLLITGMFITLAWIGQIPVWLAAVVILRDVVIVSGAVAYNFIVRPVPGEPTRISKLNEKLFQMNEAQIAPAHDHDEYFSVPFPEAIRQSPPLVGMPQTAQNVADTYDLTREEMDAFAAESHNKCHAAYEAGIYKDEVVPLEVEDPVFDDKGNWVEAETGDTVTFDRDECIRPGTTAEKLASLNPIKGLISFTGAELRITPGNSCPTNDGVTAALIMSEEKAQALGLEPLARIVGMAVGGVKPQLMGIGPIVSTKKALKSAGLEAGQIDRVEFNEAFAAQVLPSVRELGIDMEKINVNGGSLGIGHPLGATGARLVTTVAKELRRSNTRYGLATQCIGAGMGISTILERLD